eukprot:521001_1
MNVFSLVKIDEEYNKNKVLFNVAKDKEIDENACVHRLVFILKMYQKWVEFQTQNTSNIVIPNMRDIIDNEIHKSYDLDAFLSDYRFVIYSKRHAFGYFDDNNNELNQLECGVSNCYMLKRNNRNKAE